MSRDPVADTVPIPRSEVMQCTANEGGYKSFKCLACGASGWEMHFKHKPGCAYAVGVDTSDGGQR